MKDYLIMGVDPGFASFGVTLMKIQNREIIHMGVVRTKKTTKKFNILVADDNFRRLMDIAEGLRGIVEKYSPSVICGESLSYPRNAASAAKVAMTWGVLAAIAKDKKLPVLQLSPQEVRRRIFKDQVKGNKGKDVVKVAMQKEFATTDFDYLLRLVPTTEREHAWDALACIFACLDSEVIKLLDLVSKS